MKCKNFEHMNSLIEVYKYVPIFQMIKYDAANMLKK